MPIGSKCSRLRVERADGMIDLGPYSLYILASYAVTGLVLGVMIGSSVLGARAARRRLARAESFGRTP